VIDDKEFAEQTGPRHWWWRSLAW